MNSHDYYHILPIMEHCACMVDLLGNVGNLDKVKYFINNMPIKLNLAIYTCLLIACRIHIDASCII